MKKLSKETILKVLPKRPKDANKGTFGKVLIVAGSKSYPGAAYLACAAAYRVGAGLITLATIPLVQNIVSRKLSEVTFLLLDEVYGKIKDYDVLLLGPGLGQQNHTIRLIKQLLKQKLPKTVFDGDGLNILSKMGNWWERLQANVVLTPHPGEMARLTKLSVEEIQQNRETLARKYADAWGQIIVLKGANTVVASSGEQIKISPFANPALATAGTGDVLAGMIAGFLAQGLNGFDAACAGVYIHGMAGEMVKDELGGAGMLASDLLPLIPKVLFNISKHRIS